ncbi:hypothetical protein L1987_72043 [Smallanthus sonchifolius]|uniref:Uncharacterized protein n=1 Tax=Smallanthus sonchifolius TaxID=185202 RepID=A0ACB9AU51_9ASTR|nr:hypothetical protein L1987_72043 [Smallanthus sonchifolius]
MNVNGQSKVPPGFRFHPTEEELLHYYLRKKVACEKIDLDVIQEVDLNKLEPWDIQGSNLQTDWYFFSHKDKKYPTGTRTNRATAAGFWKATGRDKVIHSSLQRIGMRKTLVFYNGRAPHGKKSDWIMHEYRLDDIIIPIQDSTASNLCDCTHEEGWVICRLFKKKNYHKSLSGSMHMDARFCKQETKNLTHDAMQQFMNPINNKFDHLPGLESPTMTTSPRVSSTTFDHCSSIKNYNPMCDDYDQSSNWADVYTFVASQLDDQLEETKHFSSCYGESDEAGFSRPEEDMWSLARSPLDPLYHL